MKKRRSKEVVAGLTHFHSFFLLLLFAWNTLFVKDHGIMHVKGKGCGWDFLYFENLGQCMWSLNAYDISSTTPLAQPHYLLTVWPCLHPINQIGDHHSISFFLCFFVSFYFFLYFIYFLGDSSDHSIGSIISYTWDHWKFSQPLKRNSSKRSIHPKHSFRVKL